MSLCMYLKDQSVKSRLEKDEACVRFTIKSSTFFGEFDENDPEFSDQESDDEVVDCEEPFAEIQTEILKIPENEDEEEKQDQEYIVRFTLESGCNLTFGNFINQVMTQKMNAFENVC